jgi:hypothetical protein
MNSSLVVAFATAFALIIAGALVTVVGLEYAAPGLRLLTVFVGVMVIGFGFVVILSSKEIK